MNIHAVIDRFEGSKAVLLVGDGEEQVVWPRHLLPSDVSEGDILQVNWHIDNEATVSAKAEAENLLKKILSRNLEG